MRRETLAGTASGAWLKSVWPEQSATKALPTRTLWRTLSGASGTLLTRTLSESRTINVHVHMFVVDEEMSLDTVEENIHACPKESSSTALVRQCLLPCCCKIAFLKLAVSFVEPWRTLQECTT